MKSGHTVVRWLAALVFVTLTAQSAAVFAAKGIIKIHEGDWTGNVALTRLAQFILEDEMDYKTKVIFLPAGPAVYEAVIGGDIDVGFEFWPSYNPSKHEYFTKWGGPGTVEYFGETGFIGRTGWYVPRYVVEGDAERGIDAVAPDLVGYEDLEKYKELFAKPETAPQGRLIACPIAAWQCGDKDRVEALGIDYQTVELGSETAHWAELKAAYSRGEPILIYSWEPHWTHAQYDMVEVKLPLYNEEAWDKTDWPDDVPFNFGSPTLKDRHPDAHKFLTTMQLTAPQQSVMILDIDINGMTADAAVRKWMAANEDIWRAWIP